MCCHVFTVEIYKCDAMESTCGQCLVLEPYYHCGWCIDHCSLKDRCKIGWLDRAQICPNPQITSVSMTHRTLYTTSGCNPSFRLSIILLLGGDISINPGPKTFQNMHFATTNLRSVHHKSAALSDLMLFKHIDILALTETWLSASDTSACLADICLYDFCLYQHPRRSAGRGGGVAFLVPEIYIK